MRFGLRTKSMAEYVWKFYKKLAKHLDGVISDYFLANSRRWDAGPPIKTWEKRNRLRVDLGPKPC